MKRKLASAESGHAAALAGRREADEKNALLRAQVMPQNRCHCLDAPFAACSLRCLFPSLVPFADVTAWKLPWFRSLAAVATRSITTCSFLRLLSAVGSHSSMTLWLALITTTSCSNSYSYSYSTALTVLPHFLVPRAQRADCLYSHYFPLTFHDTASTLTVFC